MWLTVMNVAGLYVPAIPKDLRIVIRLVRDRPMSSVKDGKQVI